MTFTLTLTALAMTGGIVFGTLLADAAALRLQAAVDARRRLCQLMRSIPLVLVIFWFFFLVPYIGAWILREPNPIKVGTFLVGAHSPSPCSRPPTTARSCAPASSRSPRGQVWSGYALGLNYWQTNGKIVLPQAFRNMLPVLLTQTIILFQDTSLVYVISATDFLARLPRSRTATTAWSRCTASSPSCTS